MTVVRAYSSKGKGALLKTPEFQGTPQESYSFFSGVNTKEKQTSPREAKIHSQLDQDSLHAMSPSARKKKKIQSSEEVSIIQGLHGFHKQHQEVYESTRHANKKIVSRGSMNFI